MSTAERRDELLRLARLHGYLSVSDAARSLRVDASTVRRDFARLEELGLLIRSHGGATPVRDEAETPYDQKLVRRVAEKRAIAIAVAELVPDKASIMLDSGSTALMVARALAEREGLTVISPDIRVAAEFIVRPGIRLIMPGGEAVPSTYTIVSQEAVEAIGRYHVDLAVICADAVDDAGVTNSNSAVVPLKRAMMSSAAQAVLAIDSSKLGARRLIRVATLDQFSQIITDDRADITEVSRYPIPVVRAAVHREDALERV